MIFAGRECSTRVTLGPPTARLEAARQLSDLGLINLQLLQTVRCAHPPDRDFPPPTPSCDGLIDLRHDADEGGGDYRCPCCERIVFPEADRKHVFDSLVVRHRPAGIEAFLIDGCGELAAGRAFTGGVLALSVQGTNAAVCLLDYCQDERWLGRGVGLNQRCVYVTAGPDLASRVIAEDAIAHVELVDLLLDLKDLQATIIERATSAPPLLANLDPLVYSLGARPAAPEPREGPEPRPEDRDAARLYKLEALVGRAAGEAVPLLAELLGVDGQRSLSAARAERRRGARGRSRR